MSPIITIGLYSLTTFLCFVWAISPLNSLTPQLIALIAILYILLPRRPLHLILSAIAAVTLITFSTHGLQSPLFFLVYFLLTVIAFKEPPLVTIAYSLVLIILYSQFLNSPVSLVPLLSLPFIAPLAYFISRQQLQNQNLGEEISRKDTDTALFVSLKLKTGLASIIDLSSQLLSQPSLNFTQKEQLRSLKATSRSLLKSAQSLTEDTDDDTQDSD